jgi:tetratricopeptide (TPR) repeat protein
MPFTAVQMTLDAFHEGDYERAVKYCDAFKVGDEVTPTYCFFRGTLLMQLGEFDESERYLRQNVTLERSPQLLAIGFSSLAQLMIRLGRFDGALEYSWAGLRHRPGNSGLHRDMAEALLRRGDSPGRALGLARLAVDEETQPGPGFRNPNQGENLATLAWALARCRGNRKEVDGLVTEAVSQVGSQSVSSVAQVRVHSGLAYAELGDRGHSLQHLWVAVSVDPNGLWGRDAKTILESQACR